MSAAEMICKLFHARTAAHMAHLQTMSFAQHKALDDFYNEIVDLADSFAETYQGIFGLIGPYPDCGLPSGKPADWINGLREYLKQTRQACCQGETTLENIHDEIQGLCAQTVYKLKFLDNPAMTESPEYEAMEHSGPPGKYMKMSKW
jgi:hypothetical protein